MNKIIQSENNKTSGFFQNYKDLIYKQKLIDAKYDEIQLKNAKYKYNEIKLKNNELKLKNAKNNELKLKKAKSNKKTIKQKFCDFFCKVFMWFYSWLFPFYSEKKPAMNIIYSIFMLICFIMIVFDPIISSSKQSFMARFNNQSKYNPKTVYITIHDSTKLDEILKKLNTRMVKEVTFSSDAVNSGQNWQSYDLKDTVNLLQLISNSCINNYMKADIYDWFRFELKHIAKNADKINGDFRRIYKNQQEGILDLGSITGTMQMNNKFDLNIHCYQSVYTMKAQVITYDIVCEDNVHCVNGNRQMIDVGKMIDIV